MRSGITGGPRKRSLGVWDDSRETIVDRIAWWCGKVAVEATGGNRTVDGVSDRV